MNEPPDQTAEFSAANLLSFCGMIVPKYCLTRSSCSRSAGVHVEEDDALRLEVGLELVVDDLGLVLGADTGEVLLLRLGDPELVPRVLDVGGQVLPGGGLLLGRLDVVVDVVEVDPGEVGAPARHRPREEVVEALVPELPHPLRLVLVLRDGLDDLVRDASARLEEVVLRLVRVREPVLVVGADLANDVGLVRAHWLTSGDTRGREGLVALRFELVGELRTAFFNDTPVHEHVHEVGRDVVEYPLVVRDHERAHLGADESVHAVRHDLERVDVEARVGLVQHRDPRLQHRHLQDLDALLLAAGEAVVQVARGELARNLQLLHRRQQLGAELRDRHRVVLAAVRRLAAAR